MTETSLQEMCYQDNPYMVTCFQHAMAYNEDVLQTWKHIFTHSLSSHEENQLMSLS